MEEHYLRMFKSRVNTSVACHHSRKPLSVVNNDRTGKSKLEKENNFTSHAVLFGHNIFPVLIYIYFNKGSPPEPKHMFGVNPMYENVNTQN